MAFPSLSVPRGSWSRKFQILWGCLHILWPIWPYFFDWGVGPGWKTPSSPLTVTLLLLWWWWWCSEPGCPWWFISPWGRIVQEEICMGCSTAAFCASSCIHQNTKAVRTGKWIMLASSTQEACLLGSLGHTTQMASAEARVWCFHLKELLPQTSLSLGRRKCSKLTNFLKQSHEFSGALLLCLWSHCAQHGHGVMGRDPLVCAVPQSPAPEDVHKLLRLKWHERTHSLKP